MRDILFRGKTEDGRWVYGYLFVLAKNSEYEETYILGDMDEYESIYDVWKNAEKVVPETVGQFSGKYDIYGGRIFDGDIVKAMMDYGPGGWIERTVRVGFITRLGSYQWEYFDMGSIEVIGNIHDNPELLT